MTSFTFRNSSGVQHMLSRGGGQTFYQGSGVQLLSDRTCDLYWTPVPALDPHNYHEGDSLFGCLFSSFIMYPPIAACFTLI